MKLKAKDFRIGNLINCNGDIRPIDLQDLQNMEEGLDFYKAVPLDASWFLKARFNQLNQHQFQYPNSRNIYAHHINGYYSVNWDECRDKLLAKVEFVHELQNYWYATKRKELELK